LQCRRGKDAAQARAGNPRLQAKTGNFRHPRAIEMINGFPALISCLFRNACPAVARHRKGENNGREKRKPSCENSSLSAMQYKVIQPILAERIQETRHQGKRLLWRCLSPESTLDFINFWG
jgi:hypothetical protein